MNVIPVGFVRSTRASREDDHWDSEKVYVELDASEYSAEALAGLAEFSHAVILFHLHKVDPATIEKTARHPRQNPNWPKVGIFAQRGRNRPNGIGMTICRILKVDGRQLHLEGLDAIDGSPVLDIKPWVTEFGPRGEVLQPDWMTELMREYW